MDVLKVRPPASMMITLSELMLQSERASLREKDGRVARRRSSLVVGRAAHALRGSGQQPHQFSRAILSNFECFAGGEHHSAA